MKLVIKNPKIIDNFIPFDTQKLEIRILPERLARISVPYSEMDRLTVAGIRCPGFNTPAFFSGSLNGVSVKGMFGGKLVAVKHGMRSIGFDIRLENFEIYWGRDDGELGDGKCGAAEEQGCGDDVSARAPTEPSATDAAVESFASESMP